MASQLKIWEVNLCPLSLYQDVPYGFDVLVSIIWRVRCLNHTRWSHHVDLLCQNQFESHRKNSHSVG